MARDEVDAGSLVGLFDRVSARAIADCGGRPIEDLGAWPIARAVVAVLGQELRQALVAPGLGRAGVLRRR